MPQNKQYPIKIELPAPHGIMSVTDNTIEEVQTITIWDEQTANALRNALNEWISVEDRLPDFDQYVLVKLKGYVCPFDVCKYTMVFQMEFVANSISLTQSVTHWQPLNA